jgi:hypothetical protein
LLPPILLPYLVLALIASVSADAIQIAYPKNREKYIASGTTLSYKSGKKNTTTLSETCSAKYTLLSMLTTPSPFITPADEYMADTIHKSN